MQRVACGHAAENGQLGACGTSYLPQFTLCFASNLDETQHNNYCDVAWPKRMNSITNMKRNPESPPSLPSARTNLGLIDSAEAGPKYALEGGFPIRDRKFKRSSLVLLRAKPSFSRGHEGD